MNHTHTRLKKGLVVLVILLLCACALPQAAQVKADPTTAQTAATEVSPGVTVQPTANEASPTFTWTPSLQATLTASPPPTLTPSPTATPTATLTATTIPTYVKLRGEVTIDQAFCHYGPGAPYLFVYGVYKGSNLDILRRMQGGNYVEVQAIGGNNPCWVRADYMKIKGDTSKLEPVQIEDIILPPSPYYASPGGVKARRNGTQVTVSWNALELRAGDDSEQTSYIVEAVVCQKGEMVFVPAGSYKTAVMIQDEPGCSAVSHAWFVAAEKHGYTRRLAVPWPAAMDTPVP